MNFSELLDIRPGITPIIGGGGKSTLMEVLAEELSSRGRVIVTTTTKIFTPIYCPVIAAPEDMIDAPVVCVGQTYKFGKLKAPECSMEALAGLADFVLVEADGSRRLPLKAHASHEPVIPIGSNPAIYVVGADGFGKPIGQVCHRPELYAALLGVDTDAVVTPEMAAEAIRKEGFAQKIFINKTESPEDRANAARFAAACSLSVTAGSLKGRKICLL